MRTTFPTLADTARGAWPAGLRIIAADPTTDGDVERVMCGCYRTVPANEMVDLREIPAPARAAIGIASPILCHACFHHQERVGQLLHSAIAGALGMHGAVVASLESGERESLRRGWHATTARNRRLAP